MQVVSVAEFAFLIRVIKKLELFLAALPSYSSPGGEGPLVGPQPPLSPHGSALGKKIFGRSALKTSIY